MTTLADDKIRKFDTQDELNDYPVIATDIIYEGSAVGDNASGYARPLVAGDPFRGFADERADNSTGSAGDINVRVRVKGRVELPISGLAITDVGKPVYASDDNAFTLTAGANTRIGKVVRYVSSGVGIVEFNTVQNSNAYEEVFAGSITWTGGLATKATTVTGVLATDIIVASIESAPTEAAYLKEANVAANTVNLTLSAANTSNDAVIHYVISRQVL